MLPLATTGASSEFDFFLFLLQAQSLYNNICLQCMPGFIFLEPMLSEPGLGISLVKRDHLALDGPNVQLTSPT